MSIDLHDDPNVAFANPKPSQRGWDPKRRSYFEAPQFDPFVRLNILIAQRIPTVVERERGDWYTILFVGGGALDDDRECVTATVVRRRRQTHSPLSFLRFGRREAAEPRKKSLQRTFL